MPDRYRVAALFGFRSIAVKPPTMVTRTHLVPIRILIVMFA